jgi:hypothetical protein
MLASPEEIIDGAKRFADFCQSEGTEQRYIPHAATWLNNERWEDELTPSVQRDDARAKKMAEWQRIIDRGKR